jgi:hypothetical protein
LQHRLARVIGLKRIAATRTRGWQALQSGGNSSALCWRFSACMAISA